MRKLTDGEITILIKEVKKRSCLYKMAHPRYMEKMYTRAMWEDVAAKVFSQNWDKYDKQERKEKVEAMVKKWKTLRAFFTRELNNEAKNKLIYKTYTTWFRFFDDLMFLKPHIELKYYSGCSPRYLENIKKVATAEILDLDAEETITLSDTATNHAQEKHLTDVINPLQAKVKIERTSPDREILSEPIVNDEILPIRPDALEHTQTEKNIEKPIGDPNQVNELDQICEKVAGSAEANTSPSLNDEDLGPIKNIETRGAVKDNSVQLKNNEERNDPEKENTLSTVNDIDWSHFALSLVPLFCKVPEDKIEQVKIEILSTIKYNLHLSGDGMDGWRKMATQDGH